jgi:rifampin ADP-ribosylating transferase
MDRSREIPLSEDDLRVVVRYALECATTAAALLPPAVSDTRPWEALDAARTFADGGRRTRRQRTAAVEAHRAARDLGQSPAGFAARAAGDAAAAAYLHPLADATQVRHILGAGAAAAHARMLAAGEELSVDEALREPVALASPALVDVLLRFPPAPRGRSTVATTTSRLDQLLRTGR